MKKSTATRKQAFSCHFLRNGHQLGPMGSHALLELCPGGKCREGDMLWCEGWEDWVPAEQTVAALYAARRKRLFRWVAVAGGMCMLLGAAWLALSPSASGVKKARGERMHSVVQVKIGSGKAWKDLNEARDAVKKALGNVQPYGEEWCILTDYLDSFPTDLAAPLDVGQAGERLPGKVLELLRGALLTGDLGMLQYLESLGVDLNVPGPYISFGDSFDAPYYLVNCQFPLSASIIWDKKELMTYLISKMSAETRGKHGGIVLSAAAYVNDKEVAERLVEAGFAIPSGGHGGHFESFLDSARTIPMRQLLKKAGGRSVLRVNIRKDDPQSPKDVPLLNALDKLAQAVEQGKTDEAKALLIGNNELCKALSGNKERIFFGYLSVDSGWDALLKLAAREDNPGLFHLFREEEKKYPADKKRDDAHYLDEALQGGANRVAEYLAKTTQGAKEVQHCFELVCLRGGPVAVAETLLKRGAKVNELTLISAVNSGSLPLVQFLVEHRANVRASSLSDSLPPTSALIAAYSAGKLKIARYLLNHGAERKPRPMALYKAVDNGHLETVRFLIARGADVNAEVARRRPLHIACSKGPNSKAYAISAMLLKAGADPDELCFRNAVSSGNVRLVRLLKGKGIEMMTKDKEGRTALFDAVNNPQMMKELLKMRRFSVNERDNERMTPLLYSAAWSYSAAPEVLELLLAYGADASAVDGKGWNALHHRGHWQRCQSLEVEERIIALLAGKGLSLDGKDGKGDTPLLAWLKNGEIHSLPFGEAIIRQGAGINVPDAAGLTPLDWAKKRVRNGERRLEPLIKLLESKGAKALDPLAHYGEHVRSNELPKEGEVLLRCFSPVTATEISLIIFSTYGRTAEGESYTHLTELDLLDAQGKPLPREGWTVQASSEHVKEPQPARLMLDGDKKTFWHSNYAEGEMALPPHIVTVRFPNAVTFSAVRIINRDMGTSWCLYGAPRQVELRTRCSLPLVEGSAVELPNVPSCDLLLTSPVTGVSSVSLTIESSYGNTHYTHLAELDLLDKEGKVLPRKNWQAAATSTEKNKGNGDVSHLLDGDGGTVWHSAYSSGADKHPHVVTLTFPSPVSFSGLRLADRTYGIPGRPVRVRVEWKGQEEEAAPVSPAVEEKATKNNQETPEPSAGVQPLRSAPLILIDLSRQHLVLVNGGREVFSCPISSGESVGCEMGSNKTPVGRFLVHSKIGEGLPENTIFIGKRPIRVRGRWKAKGDQVLARVLPLEGCEPDNENTYERNIYLHGTNRVDKLGTPASHGCIRLAPSDIIQLFALVEPMTEVFIFESRPAKDTRLSNK